MATVIEDLMSGARATTDEQGMSVTRVFLIDDLTGPASTKMAQALSQTGIPRRGQPHPTIAGLSAFQIDYEPISPTQIRVEVIYRAPDIRFTVGDLNYEQISIDAVTELQQTQFDKDGRQMIVTARVEVEDENGNTELRDVDQVVEADIEVPRKVIRVSSNLRANDAEVASAYVGTVNNANFKGYAPRTLLCTNYSVNTPDGSDTWTREIELVYKPDSWDLTAVFIDPDTGRPQEGIRLGQGVRKFRIYREANFNGLRIRSNRI